MELSEIELTVHNIVYPLFIIIPIMIIYLSLF